VGEEVDVEDWKELGGGQTACEVREESSEGGSVGGRYTDFEGEVVTGKEDLNNASRLEQGGLRSERKESLEFWITCCCNGRNCQDLEVCENQLPRFYIILETKGKGAEKASPWMRLM
jgi:hypothetical protein